MFLGSYDDYLSTPFSREQKGFSKTESNTGIGLTIRSNQEKDDLMSEEGREHGRISPIVWWCWIKAAGGSFFLAITLLALALDRGTYTVSDWFVGIWSQSELAENNFLGFTFKSQAEGRSAQHKFVLVYIALLSFSTLAAIFRSEWIGA